MCGIAGVVGHAQAVEWTVRMNAAQHHRGPEGSGLLQLRPDVCFGHARLKIVDLSDRASQPMTSRDGRWTITFNGECFNFLELRSQLGAFPWKSGSDTEVMLEAISAWGLSKTLAAANGMFAFGLWDHLKQELTLVRDRLGEKPLTYFWDGKTLAFASEMKALKGLHSRRVQPDALDTFLALGYVPAPLGIFRDTFKVPAGHWATLRNGTFEVKRWWFPERRAEGCPLGSDAETTRQVIADAVGLRGAAEVPSAIALSGGVDSSIVAAELQQAGANLSAFTVAFEGDLSDLPYARAVAKHLGLRHEVIEASGLDSANRIADLYDEPFADSSAVGCVALAKAIGGSYKVVLDGDGADEAFGGYRHYEHITAKQLAKSAAAAVGWVDGGGSSVYVESKATFRRADRSTLMNGHSTAGLTSLLETDDYLRQQPSSALKRALWSDRHLALANGLNYKMDIALAAHGIEGRAPFLDHRLMEWSQSLPDEKLVRGREKKVLLREAYRDKLPAAVLNRRKHGFGAPVQQWLTGPMKAQVQALLPCPLLESFPQRKYSGQQQWTLFTLALWAERWRATW